MKKGLIILILIVGFYGAIFYFFPSLSENDCIWDEKFKALELNGVIEKKYIDSNQHSYPMIEIRQFGGDSLALINLIGDTTNSFNKLNIGDTIRKSSGNNSIKLKNRNGEYEIAVDFGCRN